MDRRGAGRGWPDPRNLRVPGDDAGRDHDHAYKRPTVLVTTGPFRASRNPFYVGIMLFFGGLMLTLSLDWLILVMPL